ncbi:hypothetical protein [Oceanirhabdus sp. W0125-5]|uniref:hypothetical protein n=1 Tax=Oceanirhabdus sp. W0125-5 TaxID=2999116 RepID=UPI0022F2DAFA|nr:hypothetical protein [Oceanirhabdus sp. W0125-5]WBW99475.1 hypothetical protein OW730_12225 [Oceanirhabdus sp. W0125-5]
MAKDKNKNNKENNKKNNNGHDNQSNETNSNYQDNVDKKNNGKDKENNINNEKSSEEGKKLSKEEEIKKKKEEELKLKIQLANQFDEFKSEIYKQTGLDQVDFLDALKEAETEALVKPEATLSRVRVFLQEINQIRVELAKLDTNLAGAVFYENEVFPLLNSLFFLAGLAGDLSIVARGLIQTSLAKNSKIEDALDLTYRVVRLSDRIFDLLQLKMYKLMKILRVNE